MHTLCYGGKHCNRESRQRYIMSESMQVESEHKLDGFSRTSSTHSAESLHQQEHGSCTNRKDSSTDLWDHCHSANILSPQDTAIITGDSPTKVLQV